MKKFFFKNSFLVLFVLFCCLKIITFASDKSDQYQWQQSIKSEAIHPKNQVQYFSAKKKRESEKMLYCCKVCSKGKPCGNSCINKNYTCHKSSGCACNAFKF